MTRKIIDIGIQGNDGTGDSIRESFRKVNENFENLFAVFGQGGRISFTDLDDAPDFYGANQFITTTIDGDRLITRSLVGGTGISIDYNDENEIKILSTNILSNDSTPTIKTHLNTDGFSIGNLPDPSDTVAAAFNAVHNTTITADDLAITRGYADRRYIQSSESGSATGNVIIIRDEPTSNSEYQILITDWIFGYALIPDHGFNAGSNGLAFVYQQENSTTPATNLVVDQTYFIRYFNDDRLSIHASFEDAVNNANRILVNVDPVVVNRGSEYLLDSRYDPALKGFWLKNEALPRNSSVRRQGDDMAGALFLHDHPGNLAGAGTPNGIDDLQAATKYYVDSTSFASVVNLFVAPSGNDAQPTAPVGKEGRSFAYAYASINAACKKAEEIIKLSQIEPGPYRQQVTYGNFINNAFVTSSTGTGNNKTLSVYTNGIGVDQSKVVANRDLREGSIIRGLTSGATGKVIDYNGIQGQNDIYEVELLQDTNFIEGEPLEFGQPVPEVQISIRVESGIYYEQLPIRVPTNVSIKGDEFRRCIIRPAPGISTSSWSTVYFYRDSEFDGLTRSNSSSLSPVGNKFGYHYLVDPANVNSTPKHNQDMDVFLLNDSTILRNITVQGHGGFMCVLDPEGQIQTKSPYFQTCSSFSRSTNKQSFSGGIFIDGFSGNLPATIQSKNNNTSLNVSGLTIRAPGVPNSFYIQGNRYQINAVRNYNKQQGTATIILDDNTPYEDTIFPKNIVIETPGNRSMLGNDFTQINDLGYGVVATNNAISELVSVFTYYNWASYYALNGGQIRSLNGSSCNGVYGLKSGGRDPNEVPDLVTLSDNTLQVCKVYKQTSFSSRNLAGEKSVYIDHYGFIPYNVSEIEIDHSNTRSSIIVNTVSEPNNITIINGGSGYSVGNEFDVEGGTVYVGGLKTRFRVTSVQSGGITGIEVIEPGLYSVNPVGGFPTVTGNINTFTNISGSGTGAVIRATYLGPITSYEVTNVENTPVLGQSINSQGTIISLPVIKLNINDSAGGNSGLVAPLTDGQVVIIRGLQNFKFNGIEEVRPVRPSTALEFTASTETEVYRTLSYNLSGATGESLLEDQAILTFDNSFNYTVIQTNPVKLNDTDPINNTKKMGSTAGDIRIAIAEINSDQVKNRLNSNRLIFGWGGKLHKITSYTPPSGSVSAYITISEFSYGNGSVVNTPAGIAVGFTTTRQTILRAGIQAGEPAQITVNISTCRATGHDFLDVGSGSFNQTNYPNNLLGAPAVTPTQSQEVVEETQGRVFYVSTDQDGIFRVGKFFDVDQGTGTIKFSASIALSNLDGIGFKRGTVVKEFSTDSTMTDNADDAVPTEAAVRGYINRRLGISHEGTVIPLADRIPASGGFLPTFGNPTLEANLTMGSVNGSGYRIINLNPDTSSSSDAATIGYVNQQISNTNSISKLREIFTISPTSSSIPVYIGTGNFLVNSKITGDLTSSVNVPITGTLATAIPSTGEVTTITLNSNQINSFPNSGFLQINNEFFSYTGKSGNDFTGVTRSRVSSNSNNIIGVDLTTASNHEQGSIVKSLNSSEIKLDVKSDAVVRILNPGAAGTILQSQGPGQMPTWEVLSSNSISLGDWSIENSNDDLLFKHNSINKMKLTSNGDIIVTGNITAFGTF